MDDLNFEDLINQKKVVKKSDSVVKEKIVSLDENEINFSFI